VCVCDRERERRESRKAKKDNSGWVGFVIYVYMYMYLYIYTYLHIYTHIYMYICTYITTLDGLFVRHHDVPNTKFIFRQSLILSRIFKHHCRIVANVFQSSNQNNEQSGIQVCT